MLAVCLERCKRQAAQNGRPLPHPENPWIVAFAARRERCLERSSRNLEERPAPA